MYDLVRGPLVWISFLVFILGSVYQVLRFYRLTRQVPPAPRELPPVQDAPVMVQTFDGACRLWLGQVKRTIAGTSPVTIAVSTVFHVCLLVTPLFVLGHNALLDLSWGVSLFSFSEATTDTMTLVLLACAGYFLVRRMMVPRVRAITTPYDYVVLCLAVMPFLTGYMAYHHLGDYRTVMILHMLFGELMLMAIPFTKLVHMIFFFLNRFIITNEHTLGRGGRIYA
jgi:nitrate reductase gamma subunit